MNNMVSVIITCYNLAAFVGKAIESALNQTYKNIEVIIVNDGSTDSSDAVIRQYLKDPRITYIKQKNAGQANAKNNAIKKASGQYIAFLDADDIWKIDKIEKQVNLLKNDSDAGVVYSDVIYINEEGEVIQGITKKKYFCGKVTEKLFYDNFLNFSSTLVKKECFDNIGLFDESFEMAIDWDLWLRISTEYDILYLDEATFYYRIWSGQMSKNIPKRYEYIWKIRKKFVKDFPYELSKKIIQDAWSMSYVERAWYSREIEKNKNSAFKFYVSSIRENLYNWAAWRGILKTVFS